MLRTPGFTAALAQTMEEIASAGCDAARLERALPNTLFGPAFVAVYKQVERELGRRGLALRAGRLARAARRIEREGLGGVHTVWMDGFFALTDPELSVIRALSAHADLTVTLPQRQGANATRDALLQMGFTERILERRRTEPAVEAFSAPTVDREANEIARRILQRADFGQIGIVVRNPEIYLPPLRAALERFGIPARFYFSDSLSDHGAVKCLSGVVEALISGWDHERVLRAIPAAPHLTSADSQASSTLDRFDFAVRERLPGRGLEALRKFTEDSQLLRLLDELAALDPWRTATHTPSQWALRLTSLRTLLPPPHPQDDATVERVTLWRSQASALAAWEAAMAEAARALDADRKIRLADFWEAAQAVVRLTPLRVSDQRRNVVHVLSVFEARQWELPTVFVCGLAEQQFPKRQAQEPLFPDSVAVAPRASWNSRSHRSRIRARRAFPIRRCPHKGHRNTDAKLRGSRFAGRPAACHRNFSSARPSLLRRSCAPSRNPEPCRPRPWRSIARGTIFSPSSLECFLDCPFQYFARHTLRLKTRPPLPQDRLDFMLQGTIVHQTLAEWHRHPQPIEPLFDRIFAACCEKNAVFPGYRAEYLRRQMLDDLLQFGDKQKLPAAAETLAEEEFVMAIDDSLIVRGRIDRIDKLADGRALIVDYKYSGAANVCRQAGESHAAARRVSTRWLWSAPKA